MAGKQAPTFNDAISQIAGELASAMQLPDADVDFGSKLFAAITGWSRQKAQQPQGQSGPPGAGQPGQGQQAGGPPPGLSMPGGPAGGGSPNQTQPNQAAPSLGGRGPTQGLTPNPDEMRRVMQQATAG